MAVAWGAKDTATQLTSVTTGSFFDDTPALDANQYAHVQVSGLTSGVTDDLDVSVFSTVDSSSEVWDTVPVFQFELTMASTVSNIVSFLVKDVYKFRVQAARSGATDSFTADMSHRIATMS